MILREVIMQVLSQSPILTLSGALSSIGISKYFQVIMQVFLLHQVCSRRPNRPASASSVFEGEVLLTCVQASEWQMALHLQAWMVRPSLHTATAAPARVGRGVLVFGVCMI